MSDSFDYIVIGAGSAGATLAAKLTDKSSHSVLLLEAGPMDSNRWIHIPAGASKTISDPSVNWMYYSEPEPGLNGRQIYHPRGKVLGGTSAINGMAYIRGNAWDYDQWAQAGNTGWSWDDVLPYFRDTERNNNFDNPAHGNSGKIGVAHGTLQHPASKLFFKGAQATGLSETADFNDGYGQQGYGWLQYTIENGTRTTTAAFLRDAEAKQNLVIRTEALVNRLILSEGRATGVEYTRNGDTQTVTARREVIVAGGAFNSPHILNLSGIGAGDELSEHGIDVTHNLPGVGKNLQDHMYVNHVARVQPQYSINKEIQGLRLIPQVLKYLMTKRGHLSLGVSNACVFDRVMPHSEACDVQIMFRPVSIDYSSGTPAIHKWPGISTSITQLRPESRGKVFLKSANPQDKPGVFFNYLDAEADFLCLTEGFRKIEQIFAAPELQAIVDRMEAPTQSGMSDADLRTYIRDTAQTVYHPVGTCKMGSDTMAVVDDRLRVHGIDGLRVADASIMPTICSGNTNAPSIMIGAKCADLILEDAA